MSVNPTSLTRKIKERALDLGFSFCGIARAEKLLGEANFLNHWIAKGFQGSMHYMTNNLDKRLDPRLLVDNARSIICLLHNYSPPEELFPKHSDYKIGRYAFGKDYHDVLKGKMNALASYIKTLFPEDINYRCFTDSAPVLEKAWAVRAGLGWIGKNTCLIVPKNGSFYFISEIITDALLAYDLPFKENHCGNCKQCIEACPTGALVDAYTLDAGKCIAYLTIESRGTIPREYKGKFSGQIFGCDICQEVCPHNRFATPHTEADFLPPDELLQMTNTDWENLSEQKFSALFKSSSVKRAKYDGLKRNIAFADCSNND